MDLINESFKGNKFIIEPSRKDGFFNLFESLKKEQNKQQLQMDLIEEQIQYSRNRIKMTALVKQEKAEQIQKYLMEESLQHIVCRYKIKQKDLAKQAKVDPASLAKYLKGIKPMSLNMKKHLIDSLIELAQDLEKRMSLLQKDLKKWSKTDDTDEDI